MRKEKVVEESRFYRFFLQATSPHYQVIAFLTTMTLTLLIAYQPFVEFRSYDPSSEIFPFTPQDAKYWGGEPAKVEVGLYITGFREFDMIRGRFICDGMIWFLFDPALVSAETVSRFSFENGEIVERSEPDAKLIGGKLFLKYNVRISFSSTLNFEFFPFDDHRVSIGLINRHVSPGEMMFNVRLSSFLLSSTVYIGGWQIVDRWVSFGYAKAQLDAHDERKTVYHPKVLFVFSLQRAGIQGILLIILPLMLMCFIGLFALGLDPEKNVTPMLSLASGSVASLIAYRFVIQQISPGVGYFMLSDFMFIFALTSAFVVFALTVFLIRVGRITGGLAILRGGIFFSVHLVFILSWWYFLYFYFAR